MMMSGKIVRRFLAITAIALIAFTGCAAPQAVESQKNDAAPVDIQPVAMAVPNETLTSVADVVAKVKPSVVAIDTETTSYDMFRRSFTQEGAGSGWIISEDGYIVTNSHVVEGAESVTVTLDDGRTFEADDVYADALTDLAVVKIDATGLPVAQIGDSSALRVGDPVVAIGNSLGMGISATAGIASVVGARLEASPGQEILDLIQTDAAINPGNSGGPLINSAGEVVGINSIKIATVGVEGMGYAISVDQALPVIEDLVDHGKVVRPWLGVGLYTVTPELADRYALSVDEGVLITEVVADSPAHDAALRPGDVIVQFAGEEVVTAQDLANLIGDHAVGDEVEIVYWREDTKEVTFASLSESP
jgi:serine protease Do